MPKRYTHNNYCNCLIGAFVYGIALLQGICIYRIASIEHHNYRNKKKRQNLYLKKCNDRFIHSQSYKI